MEGSRYVLGTVTCNKFAGYSMLFEGRLKVSNEFWRLGVRELLDHRKLTVIVSYQQVGGIVPEEEIRTS